MAQSIQAGMEFLASCSHGSLFLYVFFKVHITSLNFRKNPLFLSLQTPKPDKTPPSTFKTVHLTSLAL
jgi:hypothetical protein